MVKYQLTYLFFVAFEKNMCELARFQTAIVLNTINVFSVTEDKISDKF